MKNIKEICLILIENIKLIFTKNLIMIRDFVQDSWYLSSLC